MKISQNLRSKLLEILAKLSFDINELPKLSNFSLIEKLVLLMPINEKFIIIFSSFDNTLSDFLVFLHENSQSLFQRFPEVLQEFDDIFIKILLIYPFTKESIYFFYKSIKSYYNPFAKLFTYSDSEKLKSKLTNLILLMTFAGDLFIDLWDFSIFLKNLDNLMKIKRLIVPTIKLYALMQDNMDFYIKSKYEYNDLYIQFQCDLDIKFHEITDIKAQILAYKLNPLEISIVNHECYLQDKKIKPNNEDINSSETFGFIENITDFDEIKEIQTKLLLSNFLLVEGPASSGKSAILKHILSNKQQILVYIDSTTDLKSLIGAYVSGEKIGEFEFRHGPLTQALLQGFILILENFQEANEEIIIMLIKIMQNKGLHLANQQEFLRSKAGFQIIAIANFEINHTLHKKQMLQNHVDSLRKKPLEFQYALNIIEKIYNKLYNSPILEILKGIQEIFLMNTNPNTKKQQNFHNNNVRKWLNLAKRLDYFLKKTYGEQSNFTTIHLTEDFRKMILLDIYDIFLSNDQDLVKSPFFLEETMKILHLNSLISVIDSFFLQYTPQIELSSNNVIIGRLGVLLRNLFKTTSISLSISGEFSDSSINKIVYNSYSSRLLEKIAICVVLAEPCLLVGDTGCGKTTMVQHCAEIFRKKLWVYNMNPNSDAIDLIGGFKPLDIRVLLKQLLSKYIKRFQEIGNMKSNEKFLENLRNLLITKNYIVLMQCLLESLGPIKTKIIKKFQGDDEKIKNLLRKWEKFQRKLENFLTNKDKIDSNLAFHYVEGSLITALKNGDWLLIDEINLANNEVLQRVLPILEGESLLLYDKGDIKTIKRHKDFRILACMNPGKDVGKKELPENIRAKFTEFYIEDINQKTDLTVFIERQIGHLYNKEICEKIVDIYIDFKKDIEKHVLETNSNRKLHISLRNLARTLKYVINNHHVYGLERTLYDGLYLGFASSLSQSAQSIFQKTLHEKFNISPIQYQILLKKPIITPKDYMNHSGFIIRKGPLPVKPASSCNFLVTPSFEKYLRDLLRVISNTDLPILLEGPTSSGKTSMIKYLAELLGYPCVRINNHEHTDIEEYIGSYQPNVKGKLMFMEGVLLQAMRNGSWLILDELNLARSEILESLNRLLDDNKELFIAELQTTIKPHENFRIFATQNPSSYGGRKELSKAFRNRFIQLYFDEIAEEDLEVILQKRCELPPSYTKRMMLIMRDLKVFRQRSNFFIGKEGVITIRDLLKWGGRKPSTYEDLALEGYCLLAERLRNIEERQFIKEILEKHCKVKLNTQDIYEKFCAKYMKNALEDSPLFIQMNPSFVRMAALTMKALMGKEPVLLIGETGCGKTTLCQLLAFIRKSRFFALNCHKFTESSDFIGSLRPIRNREETTIALERLISSLSTENSKYSKLAIDLSNSALSLEEKLIILDKETNTKTLLEPIRNLLIREEMLFEWQDGPLVEAMTQGGVFLIDEISLAEDSVLERLNSVLEPEKRLLIPEKGGLSNIEEIEASEGFIIVATMNPGGDFGKRELSAALRNRFTEIWVENLLSKRFLTCKDEHNMVFEMIKESLERKFHGEDCLEMTKKIYEFVEMINRRICERFGFENKGITLRDVMGMIDFMDNTKDVLNDENIRCKETFYMMILNIVGFLGLGDIERKAFYEELKGYIKEKFKGGDEQNHDVEIIENHDFFGISPFVAKVMHSDSMEIDEKIKSFSIKSAKIKENLYNVLRCLQVNKAVLLEGTPGIGKSSMIEYLARKLNKKLLKITLTEQTDIVDLLGSDFPIDSSSLSLEHPQETHIKGRFQWYDGIILDALRKGHWLILDELNLANQSILEGLNAILDYRGTVFIPEINKKFEKHKDFRVFAIQSPMSLGGGRKGLPSSFLNRFNKLYIEDLDDIDMIEILKELFYGSNEEFIRKLIIFTREVKTGYEYKLLDYIRFFEIKENYDVFAAFEMIFLINIREFDIRQKTIELFKKYFEISLENRNNTSLNSLCKLPLLAAEHMNNYVFLNKHREILPYFSKAIDLGYPIMLIGGDGCGKKSIIKVFSSYFHKEIEEITLNPATDINELIGSYEQIDGFSELKRMTKDLLVLIKHNINRNTSIIQRKLEIYKEIYDIISKDILEDDGIICLDSLLNEANTMFSEEFQENHKIIDRIRCKLCEIKAHRSGSSMFQWIPSKVIEAMIEGKWLVLDNLGLMNPAIISRINPLLKGIGSYIYVSESHDADGQPLIIKAHKDFRIILLWNHDQTNAISTYISAKCIRINVDYEISLHINEENNCFYSDLSLLYRYEGICENNDGFIKIWSILKVFYEKAVKMKYFTHFSGNLRVFTRLIEDIKMKILINEKNSSFDEILECSFMKIFNALSIKYGLRTEDFNEILIEYKKNIAFESNKQIMRIFKGISSKYDISKLYIEFCNKDEETLIKTIKTSVFLDFKEISLILASNETLIRRLMSFIEGYMIKIDKNAYFHHFLEIFMIMCLEGFGLANEEKYLKFTKNRYFQRIINGFIDKIHDISRNTSNSMLYNDILTLEGVVIRLANSVNEEKIIKFTSKLMYFQDFLNNRLTSQKTNIIVDYMKNEKILMKTTNLFNFSLWKALELYIYQANSIGKHEIQRKILYYITGDQHSQVVEYSYETGYTEHIHTIRDKIHVLFSNNSDFLEKSLKFLSIMYFPAINPTSNENMLLSAFEDEIIRVFQQESQKYEGFSLQITDENQRNEVLRDIKIMGSSEAKNYWISKIYENKEFICFFDFLKKINNHNLIHTIYKPNKQFSEVLQGILIENCNYKGLSSIFIAYLQGLNEKNSENMVFFVRILLEIEGLRVNEQEFAELAKYLRKITFRNLSIYQEINQRIQYQINSFLTNTLEKHEEFSQICLNWILKKLCNSYAIDIIEENQCISRIIDILRNNEILRKNEEIYDFICQLQEFLKINENTSNIHIFNINLGLFLYKAFKFHSKDESSGGNKNQGGIYRLLSQDIEYGIKKAIFQQKTDFQFAGFTLQRILFESINIDENAPNIFKIQRQNLELLALKKKLINRGINDNTAKIFDAFLSHIVGDLFQIDEMISIIEKKGLFSYDTIELTTEMHTYIYAFIEKLKNLIKSSYEQFFLGFQDILLPLYMSFILLIKGFSYMKEKKTYLFNEILIQRPHNIDEMLLIFEGLHRRKAINEELLKEFLVHCYMKMNEIFTEHDISIQESLHKQGFVIKNDRTSRYKVITTEFNRKIRDEYTEEAVLEEKKNIEKEIFVEFNDFKEDFNVFMDDDIKFKEKTMFLNNINKNLMMTGEKSYEKALVLLGSIINFQLIAIYKNKTFLTKTDIAMKNSVYDSYLPWKQLSYFIDFKEEILFFSRDFKDNSVNFFEKGGISNEFLMFSSNFANFMDKFNILTQKKSMKTANNVYEDINPVETQSVILPLNAVLSRVKSLLSLETFENNALLQNIALLCDFMLDNSLLETPISKILTGVQFLMEKIEEWNTMVPKIYEIKEENEKLLEILLKWRRMERNGWKIMLLKKEFEGNRADIEIFWLLQNTLADINKSKIFNENELFTTLDNFFTQSKVGGFIQRLRMLSLLLEIGNYEVGIMKIMKQIKGFYGQYIENFIQRKENTRKSLETEIKEYEELVGWKSRNYLILRDTCEKFRKKINRISKKYQEILQMSLEDYLLKPYRDSMLFDSLENFLDFFKTLYNPADKPKAFFQYKGIKSLHILEKAHKILRKASLKLPMHYYYEENPCKTLKTEENERFSTSYEYINSIIELLFNRINDLKQENVTKLMKFRALQDLYKVLKDIGLTSLYKTYSNAELIYQFELYELQEENTNIYDKNISKNDFSNENAWIEHFFNRFSKNLSKEYRNYSYFHKNLQKLLEKSEGYYYKVLDRLSVLRARNDFHEDIALLHIRKGIGFIIEMFYMFRNHYKQFTEILMYYQKINRFNQFFIKLHKISFNHNEFLVKSSHFEEDFLRKALKFFNKTFDTLEENKSLFLENNEFIKNNEENIKNVLEAKEKIERILTEKSLISSEFFIYNKDLESLKEIIERLSLNIENISSTTAFIKDNKVKILILHRNEQILNENRDIYDFLNKKIEEYNKTPDFIAQNEELGKEEIWEKYIETCQLSIQSISKLFIDYKQKIDSFMCNEESTEVNNKTNLSFLAIESELKSKYLTILRYIFNETEGIYREKFSVITKISSENIQNIKNLQILTSLIVLIAKFNEFSINYNAKFLKSFSKLSYIISIILSNLFYKGFCHARNDKENEKNAENDENTDFIEGTGIGEGQGQENISKEIEFEEQVLGHKNEKPEENPEKNAEKKEKDKEDEGINMENDFEGENFSDKDKENEENEEESKENNDKNKENDDEFSHVDEEIDYDLWNKEEMEESEGINEEKEQERDLEDLELDAKDNPINKETQTRAKQEEAKKDKKRNLDDFDQTKNKEKDINDLDDDEEEEKQGNSEDEFEEIEDDRGKRLGDPMEEEEIEKKSLDLDEVEPENKPEGSQGEGGESIDKEEETMKDPLDKKENEENSIEHEDDDMGDNEEKQKEAEGNEGNEGEERGFEDIEEEDNENIEENEENEENDMKTSGLKPKETKEKTYGTKDLMAGEQEIIEEENENDQKKQEFGKGEGKEGGEEVNEQEKKQENKDNIGFSEEFIKAIIEHTSQIYDKNQMEAFIKDLNVINERKENKNQEKNKQEIKEKMEFEAFEGDNAKGLVTNLPNIHETEEKLDQLEENIEKNEKKTEITKTGNENDKMELEEEKREEKEGNENKGTSRKKEQKYEEKQMEFEPNLHNSQQIPKLLDKKQEEIHIEEEENQLENIKDLLNSKKSQEDRKMEIIELIKEWKQNSQDYEKSLKLWNEIEAEARFYSIQLCEELKSVLEPNEISSFKGDYKSGKRINMKKIIPYIASNFKKDKIWLRRNNPSKRKYQILLGIDNSLSMKEKDVGYFALESLTILSLALAKLEVGEIAIAAIDDGMSLLHNFDAPLTTAQTPYLLSRFSFEFNNSNSSDLALVKFMRESIDIFKEVSNGQNNVHQICFILSDGRFNKKIVKPLVVEAEENNILYVFVILDKKEHSDSIYNIKSTDQSYFDGKLVIKMRNYLEDFPFGNYIVINQMNELNKVLVDILRQYFDRVNS